MGSYKASSVPYSVLPVTNCDVEVSCKRVSDLRNSQCRIFPVDHRFLLALPDVEMGQQLDASSYSGTVSALEAMRTNQYSFD